MHRKFDLTGLKMPSLDGFAVAIDGNYDADQLTALFVNDWIVFTECDQKCGRHSYCRFTKPDPNRPRRLKDIRCGVAVEAVRNLVQCTFRPACQLTSECRQHYLDGVFHFTAFVNKAEQYIGGMIWGDFLDYLGSDEMQTAFFTSTTRLREHLDEFAGAFDRAGLLRFKKTVILVEGTSEKVFLERLRGVRFVWFKNLHVETYAGRPNSKFSKVRLYALRLQKQGYQLFIQGDRDGHNQPLFVDLISKGIVRKEHTFLFQFDFETAFPPDIQLAALHSLGMLGSVDLAQFKKRVMAQTGKSLADRLRTEFSIDLSDHKTALAKAFADLLIQRDTLFQDASFRKTEIGIFLDAIRGLGW